VPMDAAGRPSEAAGDDGAAPGPRAGLKACSHVQKKGPPEG
jgi:hypothetical protein